MACLPDYFTLPSIFTFTDLQKVTYETMGYRIGQKIQTNVITHFKKQKK